MLKYRATQNMLFMVVTDAAFQPDKSRLKKSVLPGVMVVKHTSDRCAPKPVFFFVEVDEEAATAFIAWRSPELVRSAPN